MTAKPEFIWVPLTGKASGKMMLVDATWHDHFASHSAFVGSHGYAITRNPEGGQILVHRLVTGCRKGDGQTVDHINHNILDNRSSNLRVSGDRSINGANKHVGPDRGVYWRANRWEAKGQLNGKTYYLGRFMDKAEARRAAHEFRAKHLAGYPGDILIDADADRES